MTVVPFGHAHVLPAARLVANGVARLRRSVPALPDAWSDPGSVARVITGLVDRGGGLAVLDDGDLVAFQAAVVLDGHGGRWAYTPDFGHASRGRAGPRLRERLYADLAEGWIRDACPEHVVTVLADDRLALATFAELGFGHVVIDLMRDASPVDADPLPGGVEIRRAAAADAGAVAELDAGLRRHLRASPVFLRLGAAPSPELHRRQIEDPAAATFLAERDGRAIAFLRIGPCATDVAAVVRDPGTASITAAYTRPELRGAGIASALTAAAIDWARAAGYVRCAVDHESATRQAARFWARHFTPVAISVARRLPPGTVP